MTASNQPQRRLRPVVTPNSPPMVRSASPSSSNSSVGKGPAAHARGVRLEDADHAADLRRAHARARAGAARGRVGGGDEGVRAVVDVQQRALAALEEDDLVVVDGPVEDQGGVGDIALDLVRVAQQLLHDLLRGDRAAVVELGEDLVLEVEGRLDLLEQDRLVEEVLDADADPVDLVGVGGPDAAARGTDLPRAEEAFRHLVEGGVIRRDQVSVTAEQELGGVDAALVQSAQLGEQDRRVDDDPVADDRDTSRGENSGREKVERVLLVADDDRVAGVVAALVAHHVIDRAAEQVGGLSLAFVTPLSTEQHKCGHRRTPLPGGACPTCMALFAIARAVDRCPR